MKTLFSLYKKLLPPISKTESEALNAGGVWWDAELFAGRPDWKTLIDLPITQLSEEEQNFITFKVNEVCSMVDDWKINHDDHDLPPEVWEFLKKEKFFGMNIKKEYGGLEFSAMAQSRVISMLSSRNLSLAITAMVPNSLGPGELLYHFGTQDQKDRFLPRLAVGDEVPAFALTGPSSGSDAASMPDDGVVILGPGGKPHIKLNWEKRYITLGPVCTLLGLAFKLRDPDGILDGLPSFQKNEVNRGITLALIPTNLEGVSIGRRHIPADQAFMNGPNWGKDVVIPISNVIGGVDGIGKGWSMLMSCLAVGRAISLPALSMSGAKMSTRISTAYGMIREQFRIPLARMEGIEEPLSRIIGNTYLIEAANEMTCSALDQGHKPSVISAIMKYEATERMRRCVTDAMDIMGGKAISGGPSNLMFNSYISQPIAITVEGANIMTRSLIIFAQGGLRCHPFLAKEVQAVQDDDKDAFYKAIRGHLAYTVSNLLTAPFHNLTGGKFLKIPPKTNVSRKKYGVDSRTRHWYRDLARESRNFALLSDITLMLLGGSVKKKQKLSGRFADILSELYLMSSALKKFETDHHIECDRDMVTWCMKNGLYRIQTAFDEILQNYPNKFLGAMFRRMIFPYGFRYKAVSFKLQNRIVVGAIIPGFIRNRLIANTYCPENESEEVKFLEDTFVLKHKMSHDWTLDKDVFAKRVKRIIDVDNFDEDLK